MVLSVGALFQDHSLWIVRVQRCPPVKVNKNAKNSFIGYNESYVAKPLRFQCCLFLAAPVLLPSQNGTPECVAMHYPLGRDAFWSNIAGKEEPRNDQEGAAGSGPENKLPFPCAKVK